MTAIIAALIAAAVATFGYVITARAKLLEDRRKTYAEALAAVHAYQELPHRIRRRPDSSPATLDKLNSGVHITRLPKRREIRARNSATRHGRNRRL
jgi:hypothetical protein